MGAGGGVIVLQLHAVVLGKVVDVLAGAEALGGGGDSVVVVVQDDLADDLSLRHVPGRGGRGLSIDDDGPAELFLAALHVEVGGEVDHGAVVLAHDLVGQLVVVGDGDVGLALHGLGVAGELVAGHHALDAHGAVLGVQQGVAVGVGVLDGAVGAGGGHHLLGLGVQCVIDHLGGAVTVQGDAGVDAPQAVVQLGVDAVGDLVGVDGPVDAGEAIHLGIIAQGGQEHLGGLGTGDLALGIEGAVAAAVDDAGAVAVLDVALIPAALDVGKAGGDLGAQHGVGAAVHGPGDHLGHLAAGDLSGGIEAAVVIAVDDAQGSGDLDSLGVGDFFLVGEITGARSRGADHHHAREHGSGQTQAENALEVVHGNSSFCFWRGRSFCRRILIFRGFSGI